MTFKFDCHGCYIHDFRSSGSLERGRELTESEADTILSASPFLTAETAPHHELLLNKGFAVVSRDGDRCAIVYNHDGRYALWTGAWAFFSAKYNLSETP